MSFTWHHPSYYKKLKQNSGGPSNGPSKDNVSEVHHIPPTMETSKVGLVGASVIALTPTRRRKNNV